MTRYCPISALVLIFGFAYASLCQLDAVQADSLPRPAPLPRSIQKRVDILSAEVRDNLKRQTGDRAIAFVHPLSEDEQTALRAEIPDGCPVRVQDLVAVDVRFHRADGTEGVGRLIVARYFSAAAFDKHKQVRPDYWRKLKRIHKKRQLAQELADLFIANYRAENAYPIQHVIPLHYFRALSTARSIEIDDLSMQHNNTYAFAVRRVIDTDRWSRHAIGSLDINPFYNPFIVRTDKGKRTRVNMTSLTQKTLDEEYIRVSPPGSERYAFNRKSLKDPHVIADKRAFIVKHLTKRGWLWGGGFRTMKDYHHFSPR